MTPVQLDVVLKYLRINGLTLPLSTTSAGRTTGELSRIAKAELPRMESLGLVIDDEVPPPLVDALGALAEPHLWIDSIWYPQVGADHCWRAVAVLTPDDEVVLGVQAPSENPKRGGLLTVEVHNRVSLAQALLGTLPPAPPGNRGTVRVPETSFRTDEQPADDFGQQSLMQGGTPARARASSGDRQVALYQAISHAEHLRIGQLAANLRDRNGRRNRSQIAWWLDNHEPDGRYLNRTERGSTGERVFAMLPADARMIGGQVEALIAQVR
nr:ESX secretion-associated protein EspG [Saccharopolyspora sp. HNM0983]